jgi:hypothetical protein
MSFARSLLVQDELPSGGMDRYYLDLWRVSGSKVPYEEFRLRCAKEHVEYGCKEPVIFDKTAKVADGVTIHFFKRKGESMSCHLCDMNQNGGAGDISLQEALSLVKDPELEKEIKELGA